jgi:hypothetical protein
LKQKKPHHAGDDLIGIEKAFRIDYHWHNIPSNSTIPLGRIYRIQVYSVPSLFNVESNWTDGGIVRLTTAANERAESNKKAGEFGFLSRTV